ncbi:MAG TPA: Crp/Fnr family transcriptional regulator [Anaerolineales bacterium]|jgi:CRP/FNR family transcriptional regulator|nr:Crp/Fnr family transcriptional regulator [Anaerolineales bacterium]
MPDEEKDAMTSQDKSSATSIDEALAKSLLAAFPPKLRQTLTRDAIPLDLPAGTTLYYEEDEPRCGLVITGLIRVYMTSPDGRQITVRYARTGELLGIAAIVGGPAPVSVQILTDATLLMLNVRRLQVSGQTEPEVGWLMAQEVTRRLYDTLEALAGNTFGSLQQRIARHLLDLAASRQQGQGLVVRVTQQELADAVGSVRPVVARIVRELRVEGIISTSSDGIVILKPAELHNKTWSRDL